MSRTIADSIRRAEAWAIVLWQLILIAAVLVSEPPVPAVVLCSAHVIVMILGVVTAVLRLGLGPLLLALTAATILDYSASAGEPTALLVLTIWTTVHAAGVGALVLRTRDAIWFLVLLVAVSLYGTGPWTGASSASVQGAITVACTVIALGCAGFVLIHAMRGFAQRADRRARTASTERERSVVAERLSRSRTRDARVIHDTLINTLGVVASGFSAGRDVAELRQICRHDVRIVEALLAGEKVSEENRRLSDLPVVGALRLRRTGLRGEDLEQRVDRITPDVHRAAIAIVDELLRNTAKHARTDAAIVDFYAEDAALVVTVTDAGAVSAEPEPEPDPDPEPATGRGGWGLAQSVVARADDAGIEVSFASAGDVGARVTLKVPLDTPVLVPARRSQDVEGEIAGLRRTTGLRWSIVISAFGVVSTLLQITDPAAVIASAAMVLVVTGASWLAYGARKGRGRPAIAAAAAMAGIPLICVAGLVAIHFGQGDPIRWPTIIATPLLVILLVSGGGAGLFVAGLVVLLLSATVSILSVEVASPSGSVVLAVATAVQLIVIGAWFVFSRLAERLGRVNARVEHEIAELEIARTVRDAVAVPRARWMDAGADDALRLLSGIASGALDPGSPDVQADAAVAEESLRRVLQAGTENPHLAPWVSRIVGEARAKSVSLALRGFSHDVADSAQATSLGRVILAAIDVLPGGAIMDAGLFPSGDELRLVLVTSSGSLRDVGERVSAARPTDFSHRSVGAQDLIEASFRRSTPARCAR